MIETGKTGASAGKVGRNPDWTRDETILLMNLYLSTPKAEKGHPDVQALSHVLRAAGRRDGRAVLPSFRNPDGIAMRLRNFGKRDPDAPAGQNAGLRAGGAIDRLIWEEFSQNREGLAQEVSRIRRTISAGDWQRERRSSRGPAPAFSARAVQVSDGPCCAYLLLLDGDLSVLAPNVAPLDDHAVYKIGRTSDINRRIFELAHGLPPGAAIHYIPVCLKVLPSAEAAHVEERRLLEYCNGNSWVSGQGVRLRSVTRPQGEFLLKRSCVSTPQTGVAAPLRLY
jgi:hypothetical protein